jgi:hypothetical protein
VVASRDSLWGVDERARASRVVAAPAGACSTSLTPALPLPRSRRRRADGGGAVCAAAALAVTSPSRRTSLWRAAGTRRQWARHAWPGWPGKAQPGRACSRRAAGSWSRCRQPSGQGRRSHDDSGYRILAAAARCWRQAGPARCRAASEQASGRGRGEQLATAGSVC